MTREPDYPQPTTELADQLEQAARDLTDSALTLRNSHPGRERLIALASAYTLLTGLWRATLRDRIRGQIDVEKRRQATSWSTVARLLATAGVPLSASQLRQCTIARTGGGQAARRRRDVARRLNPDDLQAWLSMATGISGWAVSWVPGWWPSDLRMGGHLMSGCVVS